MDDIGLKNREVNFFQASVGFFILKFTQWISLDTMVVDKSRIFLCWTSINNPSNIIQIISLIRSVWPWLILNYQNGDGYWLPEYRMKSRPTLHFYLLKRLLYSICPCIKCSTPSKQMLFENMINYIQIGS